MAAIRKFVDSQGMNWQVYELSADAVSGQAHGASWLYFFSRDATRSLASYPDDWSLMDWPGLEHLCHCARPPVHRDIRPTSPVVAHVAEF